MRLRSTERILLTLETSLGKGIVFGPSRIAVFENRSERTIRKLGGSPAAPSHATLCCIRSALALMLSIGQGYAQACAH